MSDERAAREITPRLVSPCQRGQDNMEWFLPEPFTASFITFSATPFHFEKWLDIKIRNSFRKSSDSDLLKGWLKVFNNYQLIATLELVISMS